MGKRLTHFAFIIGLAFSLLIAFPIHADNPCSDQCASGLSDEAILTYSQPNVQQLYPDDNLLYDRHYEKVLNAVDYLRCSQWQCRRYP